MDTIKNTIRRFWPFVTRSSLEAAEVSRSRAQHELAVLRQEHDELRRALRKFEPRASFNANCWRDVAREESVFELEILCDPVRVAVTVDRGELGSRNANTLASAIVGRIIDRARECLTIKVRDGLLVRQL